MKHWNDYVIMREVDAQGQRPRRVRGRHCCPTPAVRSARQDRLSRPSSSSLMTARAGRLVGPQSRCGRKGSWGVKRRRTRSSAASCSDPRPSPCSSVSGGEKARLNGAHPASLSRAADGMGPGSDLTDRRSGELRCRPTAARVPSCSRPSRTLRAAARSPAAILDRRCARRLWRPQVGTTGWPS